ncbi:MAG: phenylalanine--tRNA ligase subunit alpha [Terriglobales bacterium]
MIPRPADPIAAALEGAAAPLPADAAALEAAVAALSTLLRQAAQAARTETELRAVRDGWLGRKAGVLSRLRQNWLGAAPAARKREAGQAFNQLSSLAEAVLTAAAEQAGARAAAARWEQEAVDISLPGRAAPAGPAHPVLTVLRRMTDVFARIGYSVAEGPEVETPEYNFEALNIPADHPARAGQDTLYLDAGPGAPELLLRTHTSPVQIRAMRQASPPLRVIAPGKVYRNDAPDATHSPMFHQLEGLAVDGDITLGDLKGTLDHFAQEMFPGGGVVRTRFRPSYFPFTEPSAEMDIGCLFCHGDAARQAGCRACKQSGWIEVLGCGMVHPAVFRAAGYDPERWSGFAFGMGIERIAMLAYGVDDIQRFYSGDLRFLAPFAG